MKGASVTANRVGLRHAGPGCFIVWASPDSKPLNPGFTTDPFVITSGNLPGFTSADIGRHPPFDVSPEWPEEVLNQLEPIFDPVWADRHVITFGPRYTADDSPQKIADGYLADITDLINDKRLDASAFLEEVIFKLKLIASGEEPRGLRFQEKPMTPLEQQLKQALTLCFRSPP
jgi:hypothetical protein